MNANNTERLSQAEIERLNEMFAELESEFREAHEVRLETDSLIVLADHNGHEYNEIADQEDIDRSALSEHMHTRARTVYDGDGSGDPWGVAYPLVFDKA